MNRRNVKVVAVTCLLVVAVGVGILYVLGATESPHFAEMTKAFGGRENVEVIRHATKVEVSRVRRDRDTRPTSGPANPGGVRFSVVAGPVALDRAAARRLAAATTDPDGYQYDVHPGCIFDPGYVARFTAGDSVVEVIYCFHCGEIAVSRGRYLTMGAGRDRLLAALDAALAAGPR